MKFARTLLIVSCMIVSAGCSVPNAPMAAQTAQPSATISAPTYTTVPIATALPEPTAAPPANPGDSGQTGLTLAALENATYRVPMYNRPVQLLHGKFEGGSGEDYLMAMIVPGMAAFGDLDGDGVEDAALLIAENGGGSGVFVSLMVVYNRDGAAVQGGTAPIDDRPRIERVSIDDGKIRVEGIIHGPGDVMINPTLPVDEIFEPAEPQLRLVKLSTRTATGSTRSIEIESPAEGMEVSQSVQVKGSMPIAPFENSLAYRIFDQGGKLLAEGPFAVSAEAPGAPAIFDQSVDLSAIPAGPIRLELLELSMADGSTLAMDSLALTVK